MKDGFYWIYDATESEWTVVHVYSWGHEPNRHTDVSFTGNDETYPLDRVKAWQGWTFGPRIDEPQPILPPIPHEEEKGHGSEVKS